MTQSKPPVEPSSGEADNHPPQPRSDDVVLGGSAPIPADGVVLGGLEGVKRRLAVAAIEQRVAALKEALQYGEAGLELVMLGLEDKSRQVQYAAFCLLAAQDSPQVKQRLRNYLPWFEFEVETVDARGQESNRYRNQTRYFLEDLGNGVFLEMVSIPGGIFLMSLCINPSCPKPETPDNLLFCPTCGSELLLEGRYRATRELGKGGFGKTYEVSDCAKRTAASGDRNMPKVLKILTNNDAKYVELFQREAEVLSKLNHSGIPQVEPEGYFTVFPRNSTEPIHCLVMEYIEGLNLEEYLKQRENRPINQKLALQYLTELAPLLKEVLSHNFFHRDIKPSNIMLKPDGNLALIDFGIARKVTSTIMAGGQHTQAYTPGYAAPEQEKGYAVLQSDFFALGRTFVYLLTGKHPNQFYDPYTDECNWHPAATHVSSL